MAIETINYQIIIPTSEQAQEAGAVAKWTKTSKTMLPKSEGEILTLFDRGWSVLLQIDGVPASHAAITFDWEHEWMELGAVVTDKGFRGMGLATIAVNTLLAVARERYPQRKYFALCNQYSLGIFKDKFGGVEMDPGLLPETVWGECCNCPNFQEAKAAGKSCCDTPVNMTEVGKHPFAPGALRRDFDSGSRKGGLYD